MMTMMTMTLYSAAADTRPTAATVVTRPAMRTDTDRLTRDRQTRLASQPFFQKPAKSWESWEYQRLHSLLC